MHMDMTTIPPPENLWTHALGSGILERLRAIKRTASRMRRLRKRWWLWLVMLLPPNVIVVGYLLLPVPILESHFTQTTYEKIQIKMAIGAVVDILGKDNWKYPVPPERRGVGRFGVHGSKWTDKDGNTVVVIFDTEFG